MSDMSGLSIKATGINGCNILMFDGEAFAKRVSIEAISLCQIDKDLAKEYLKAMSGLQLKMIGCHASYDNSKHERI